MIMFCVLIVFFQRGAEKMAALSIGYEIKKLGVRRLERRAKSNRAGIANRSGRQSTALIGIVRRVFVQILAGERASVAALQFESVNDRGVALQQHAFSQAIFKNAGDQSPFIGLARFAFDAGSTRNSGKDRMAMCFADLPGIGSGDLRPLF